MRFFVLLLIPILLLSGCVTDTGSILHNDVLDEIHDLSERSPSLQEQNQTNTTNNTENISEIKTTESTAAPTGGSAHVQISPCDGMDCGTTEILCPDDTLLVCMNTCDPETGQCEECSITCPEHVCDMQCGPCEIFQEEECACELMENCNGNGICEAGEYGNSEDCPDCTDSDPCTQDGYDYSSGTCLHTFVQPCCGDGICGQEEQCEQDCGPEEREESGDIKIIFIDYDTANETVVLEGYAIELTNWTIEDDGANYIYTFPEGFIIMGTVTLHRGQGEDNITDLYWQKNNYVWNNDGDTATLKDNTGEIIDVYSY